jgi:hypothetical protein
MVAACGVLSLATTGWAWWERQRIDPWKRQMTQLRAALLRLGVPSADHDSPRTLAQRVRTQLGESGEPLAQGFDAIDAARYGRHGTARPDPRLTREFTDHAHRLAQARGIGRAR